MWGVVHAWPPLGEWLAGDVLAHMRHKSVEPCSRAHVSCRNGAVLKRLGALQVRHPARAIHALRATTVHVHGSQRWFKQTADPVCSMCAPLRQTCANSPSVLQRALRQPTSPAHPAMQADVAESATLSMRLCSHLSAHHMALRCPSEVRPWQRPHCECSHVSRDTAARTAPC